MKEASSSEIINQYLTKIAKGTAIVFLGTAIGMLLLFAARVIVARYLTQSEYGIFSLLVIILAVFTMLSSLGLQQGATRYIAFFKAKGDAEKVRGVIFSSIQIAVIASIALAIVAFLSSDLISQKIFHMEELATPLKILSVTIPFIVLIGILASIFRGFARVTVQVYFQDILRNVLFVLFLAISIFLGLAFRGVIYAYLASIVLTCAVFIAYAIKRPPLSIKGKGGINPVAKELLFFSFPLLGASMLHQIMLYTDTLMLGYFKTSQVVGLYNAALPLAQSILILFGSMGAIYIPLISEAYSKNLLVEMRRIYQVLTKWIFSATLPLFLVLFLFPETVLGFFFGTKYIEAAPALQILSIGLIFQTFLGAGGLTLIVIGKPRLLTWATLIAASLNVILNAILIPPMGIVGAAIASAVSYFAMGIFVSAKLYQVSKIHPFTKNYLKPVMTCGAAVVIIYAVVWSFSLIITYWMLPLLFVLFLTVYALSLLLTKSFDKEDFGLLLTIEERIGIDAGLIKRILRRFI